MRRSISWRVSTARLDSSSGSTRCSTAWRRSWGVRAENRARFTTSLGFAAKHTFMTCQTQSSVSEYWYNSQWGFEMVAAHLKGNVFALPVAIQPQYQPIVSPCLGL